MASKFSKGQAIIQELRLIGRFGDESTHYKRAPLLEGMLPPKFGTLVEQFVKDWQSSVAVNLKGGTRRAAESHLRAHIIPKLGSQPLTEINTKTIQGLVAYLASGGRSKKTV